MNGFLLAHIALNLFKIYYNFIRLVENITILSPDIGDFLLKKVLHDLMRISIRANYCVVEIRTMFVAKVPVEISVQNKSFSKLESRGRRQELLFKVHIFHVNFSSA